MTQQLLINRGLIEDILNIFSSQPFLITDKNNVVTSPGICYINVSYSFKIENYYVLHFAKISICVSI